jgi:glycosyltransferase involved in cell wall biosynthesis
MVLDERKTVRRGPKICFVTDRFPPDIGGTASSAMRLASNLDKAGYDMHIFVRSHIPPSNPLGQQSDHALPVHRVPVDPTRLRTAIDYWQESTDFSLFHGFSFPSSLACLPAAVRYGRPLVANISDFREPSYPNRGSGVILHRASWIVANDMANLARAHRIVDIASKSSIIPNGVDTSQAVLWTLGEFNRGVVGTAGTLHPERNVTPLAKAYAQLHRNTRRYLMLVGDCDPIAADYIDNRLRIDRILKTSNIEAESIRPGHVPSFEVSAFLQKMHVFVMPSDHPSMPNSLLEAAANGLPIVATAVDGIKDVFQDQINCLLVPPGDSNALSQAVAAILRDDSMARTLGIAARKLAESMSSALETTEYCKVYADLLDRQFLRDYA